MVVPRILTARLVIRTSRGKSPVVTSLLFLPLSDRPFSNARTGDGADTKGEVKGETGETGTSSASDPESAAAYGLFL